MSIPLPDAAARERIATDLETNLVVEAAAGTGKTTNLVARIRELIKAGALRDNARIAAVTFTIKAANELKQRLQAELEREAENVALSDDERQNLTDGLAALPECHIGTIHSFCARLLRERPVEAGVNPDFEEIDQDRDVLFRRRAWNEFVRRLASGEHRSLTDRFRTFGLDMDTLGEGFLEFADYPDVDLWPGSDARMGDIDPDGFCEGLLAFTESLGGFAAILENVGPETDPLIPILQGLIRRRRRAFPRRVEEAYRLCALFKPKPLPKKLYWKKMFGLGKEEVEERYEAYLRFYAETVKPFVEQCHAAVYAVSLAAYRAARDIYDRLRLEAGALNFQDLLMKTAAVLRDHPDVRRELSSRYRRVLVDEVQDTDPIQAEILFLLAATDQTERNWRRVVPRPGSLFIVGDPKQSIYRFRRADIVVYQELKDRIVKTGGDILELTANFRSQPVILDWVNDTFALPAGSAADAEGTAVSGRFSQHDSPYSPAYVPLTAGRVATEEECLTGVFCLETLAAKKATATSPGVGGADIVQDEARRIARFIRDAVDRGARVPDKNGTRPVAAGDFMIVTYQKKDAPVYAAALGRLGLECEVAAGSPLADSPPLAMLETYLTALANPDDAVAALAVLRGPLCGVSDRELYRWKKSGGYFQFQYSPADGPTDGPIATMFGRMRIHHRLFRSLEPAECLERIADDLGLWAYSCLGDDPSKQSGALFTALELLKSFRADMPGAGGLLAQLTWLRKHHDGDVMPSLPAHGNAVRVMNVHKTKGLEAPVVFLTSTRNWRKRPASFAVNRDGDKVAAGLLLSKGEFGNVVMACPRDWDRMAEREELFLAAERTRLNYVAATRAGSMLVVSAHPSSGAFKSAFLPLGDAGPVRGEKLPEPQGEIAPATEAEVRIDADELEQAGKLRQTAIASITQPTYALERAKDASSLEGAALPRYTADGGEIDPEFAADAGEILHSLLESDYPESRLIAEATELLRERERPTEMAEELARLVMTVRGSDVWRRAAKADVCFREAPFTTARTDGDMPVLLRGVIDLAFREAGGWILVDYKSDRIPAGADLTELAERHAGQLHAYARAWEKATGETVADALVFFVRVGKCVSVV